MNRAESQSDAAEISCSSLNENGVAQRLYSLIREGKIIFKSAIGDDYLLYPGMVSHPAKSEFSSYSF